MNPISRTVRATAAVLLAAALLSPAPSAFGAAPKKPDPDAPAFVNLSQVLAEYRKSAEFAKYQQKLREKGRQFNEEMQTLAQLRYCTDAERQEAITIKAKPGTTDREKTRLADLMKKADVIDTELATLSQKKDPSEADTRRLGDLSKLRTDAARKLAEEEANRRDQMRRMESDLTAEVEIELLKLVEKVAKDQKLGIVYERRAVLFGGNDLTDVVIKRLPK